MNENEEETKRILKDVEQCEDKDLLKNIVYKINKKIVETESRLNIWDMNFFDSSDDEDNDSGFKKYIIITFIFSIYIFKIVNMIIFLYFIIIF